MNYDRYKTLKLTRPEPGILEIVMGGTGKLGVADATGHAELAEIWRDLDADPRSRSPSSAAKARASRAAAASTWSSAWRRTSTPARACGARRKDLVYNLINCSKIVVSAMHGPAVGAGLVTGLLADISIAARNARIIDGHTRLGVAAGDHAAIVLAAAVRHGQGQVLPVAVRRGQRRGGRAHRPGIPVRGEERAAGQGAGGGATARARLAARSALDQVQPQQLAAMAGPTFDASLALEMLGFSGPDVREGAKSLREKRAPTFDPKCPF